MVITREIEGKEHKIVLTNEEIRLASKCYDLDCRVEDILSVITEKIAEPFEENDFLDGFPCDVKQHITFKNEDYAKSIASDMVYCVEHRLDRNDLYWEMFWDSVRSVVKDELSGTDYAAEDITVTRDEGHISIMVKERESDKDRIVGVISHDEIAIIDFDFFADADNRAILAEKLADLD